MRLRLRSREDSPCEFDIFQVLAHNNEVLDTSYQEAWDLEMSLQSDTGLSKKAFQVYLQYLPPDTHGNNARSILTVEFPGSCSSYVFQTVRGVAQWYFVPLPGFTSRHDLPKGLDLKRHSFFETTLAPVTTSLFNGLGSLLQLRADEQTCELREPAHRHYILKVLLDITGLAEYSPYPAVGTHTMHFVCGTVDWAWFICVLCGFANGNGRGLQVADGEKETMYTYGSRLVRVEDIDWPGAGRPVPLRPYHLD